MADFWKHEVLEALKERDRKESTNKEIYESCEYLPHHIPCPLVNTNDPIVQFGVDRFQELKQQLESIEKKDSQIELEKTMGQLKVQTESLNSTQRRLRQAQDKKNELEKANVELTQALNLAENRLKQCVNKLRVLKEESQTKNASLELVNDELLSLHIQNNLMNDKIESLTSENDKLVQRWMEKVTKDAELLNEANKYASQGRK
ncbi:BA75_03241T0 [Komagataella pastoris]|uniref:BA75_03241T0 n=1 Tax=Komagataella pastoris TaxID=4922 RepID=A0A1B2JD50_PICPA|nr:BA75_03241T0 [Komagataella pastoris]